MGPDCKERESLGFYVVSCMAGIVWNFGEGEASQTERRHTQSLQDAKEDGQLGFCKRGVGRVAVYRIGPAGNTAVLCRRETLVFSKKRSLCLENFEKSLYNKIYGYVRVTSSILVIALREASTTGDRRRLTRMKNIRGSKWQHLSELRAVCSLAIWHTDKDWRGQGSSRPRRKGRCARGEGSGAGE